MRLKAVESLLPLPKRLLPLECFLSFSSPLFLPFFDGARMTDVIKEGEERRLDLFPLSFPLFPSAVRRRIERESESEGQRHYFLPSFSVGVAAQKDEKKETR